MSCYYAKAAAHPNIALIKYWGDRDAQLKIPANGSISMNLAGLTSTTEVRFKHDITADRLSLNGEIIQGEGLRRVSQFLNLVRDMADIHVFTEVISTNDFPTGAGMASSASAFAALSLAASKAAGLDLDEKSLSRLARRGSGSASRSVPGGFVEWISGNSDETSFARSIAPADHWALADCIAVVSTAHKAVSSAQGHSTAPTSLFQPMRVADGPRRLEICRSAILNRDFSTLAAIVEADSQMMHAVMMTSNPSLLYWEPATIRLMKLISQWRAEGLQACFTVDAGPNVHVICPVEQAARVGSLLKRQEGVLQVFLADLTQVFDRRFDFIIRV